MNVSPGDLATYHGPNQSARGLVFLVRKASPVLREAWLVESMTVPYRCCETGTWERYGSAFDRHLRRLSDPDTDNQVERGREVEV